MYRFLKSAATLLIFILLPLTSAKAQFQLNVMGSRLISGGTIKQWGAGATLRYFTSPQVAIGLNARYFTDQPPFASGYLSSNSRTTNSVATGQLEYFTAQPQSALQPYIGLEAGLYLHRYKFDSIGADSLLHSYSGTLYNFGIGPKFGLQYAIVPSFGINAEATYQLIFGNNTRGQALLLNLGAFYKFGRQ